MSAKWRGLKSLVRDAVHHGSHAIEKLQKETANKTFVILESIPPLEAPAKTVHAVHDVAVSLVHGVIRGVNQIAASALDVVIDETSNEKDGDRR